MFFSSRFSAFKPRAVRQAAVAMTLSLGLAQQASADECYWFKAADIVPECTAAGGHGTVLNFGENQFAISCGAAACAVGRGETCLEFGIGLERQVPPSFNGEGSDMHMAWKHNSPGPTWITMATSGNPGEGSPYDACVAELRSAAATLGY